MRSKVTVKIPVNIAMSNIWAIPIMMENARLKRLLEKSARFGMNANPATVQDLGESGRNFATPEMMEYNNASEFVCQLGLDLANNSANNFKLHGIPKNAINVKNCTQKHLSDTVLLSN